jgi:hydroxyacylglutathione hydrolase
METIRPDLSVSAIRAFNDNYIWLLTRDSRSCAVVDPGDAGPVIEALEQRGLELDTILVTHHHPDHVGGIPELLQRWPANVIGPDDDRIRRRSLTVSENDRVELDRMNLTFEVLEVPGHTRSHIAYVGHGCLFPGDTLFSAGCGRLFEGTPAQMQNSLDKLARLPDETRVFCAHEYTRSNCMFALAVEPENLALQAFARWVDDQRSRDQPTVPSTMGHEREVNPFLRTREPSIVGRARTIDPAAEPGASTLAVIRQWKDRFSG